MQNWESFFVAEAGAAAALAGLVFVAVSINLARILEFPTLPMRVLEALVSLLSVLVTAIFSLVPAQSVFVYGAEIAGLGLFVWACQLVALMQTLKDDKEYAHHFVRLSTRVMMNQLSPLLLLIAGGLLLIGHAGGVYWLVPATLAGFAGGMFGAWVLLIEIQR